MSSPFLIPPDAQARATMLAEMLRRTEQSNETGDEAQQRANQRGLRKIDRSSSSTRSKQKNLAAES